MSSPSAALKVNYLIIRYLYFRGVRGDLQERNGCISRCQLTLFPVPIPVSPSTKSAFLCAFGLRDSRFLAFRAQNRGFCVRMGDFSEIFGRFDTKMGFLCSGRGKSGIGKRNRGLECKTVVWNAKPWPGMQTRGPEMQEGGLIWATLWVGCASVAAIVAIWQVGSGAAGPRNCEVRSRRGWHCCERCVARAEPMCCEPMCCE